MGKKDKKQSDSFTIEANYNKSPLIFRKYDNRKCNRRGRMNFMASVFLGIDNGKGRKLPDYEGMMQDDQLVFDSNFESANLMAVYRVVVGRSRWAAAAMIWCCRTTSTRGGLRSGTTSKSRTNATIL